MHEIHHHDVLKITLPGDPGIVIVCQPEQALCFAIRATNNALAHCLHINDAPAAIRHLETLKALTACSPCNTAMLISELREIGFSVSEPVKVGFVSNVPESGTIEEEDTP